MRHVWERIVEAAIERDVDLVVLTGDVIDRDNRFYEAIGPLERGVVRLADRGIDTVCVAGNHDFDALTWVADSLEDQPFHLLGRGGQWEKHVVERGGAPAIHLMGWSFPERHIADSPVVDLPEPERGDVMAIGLLHADLDQLDSPYAPVTTAELEAAWPSVWLLGHIHRPRQISKTDRDLILYPGSPQALDPGETGAHGPWIVELEPGGHLKTRQISMATVRYEMLQIDLEGVEDDGEFASRTTTALRDNLRQLAENFDSLRHVVYRLRLTGRTPLHRALMKGTITENLADNLDVTSQQVASSIDRVLVETAPRIDLEELSSGGDPPAVLARLIRRLRQGEESEEDRFLIEKFQQRIRRVHRAGAYGPLRSDPSTADLPDREWIRREAIAAAMSLLDELLASKGA